jgi:transcriptional regulator with PAS, ATPase and Fis domain
MSADAPRPFRWQALLQRAGEAVFVLDRRRRLLFVNTAWEQLTGLSAEQAHGMICRRPRPAAAEGPVEDALAHVLTPPAEVMRGTFARARRIFVPRPVETLTPGSSPLPPDRWDVEFLPLRLAGEGEGYLIVGRIIPLPADESQQPLPVPERLLDLRQRWASGFTFDLLSSTRPAMHRVLRQVRLACTVRAPVLLVGETGTGKETIARIIHYQGPERERSFAALDCWRLPSSLLAGLLFTVSGAAGSGHGTLYLDEPSGLPRDLQLRLCEWITTSGEISGAPRLLAGCAQPAEDVCTGRLLEELFSLLGPLTIAVPALRERADDLPGLVERMMTALNGQGERSVAGLTPAAWEVMRHHAWPGNLDELRQVVSDAQGRAAAERIDEGDLPAALRQAKRLEQNPLRNPSRPLPLEQTLEQVERRLIQLALQRARGNQSRAAELLGIYRGRLIRRMESLGMKAPESEKEEPTQS